MRVFVLSDPHYGRDMSRFGPIWERHEDTIRRQWRRTVAPSDLVLIPGDFSWGTTTKTVSRHLDEVNALPGQVIISPGNHDRWWRKTERLRYSEVEFLYNAHRPLNNEWTLAATMGWDCPESPWWKEEDRPIFEDACADLEETLAAATKERPNTRILLMFHYPPRWRRDETPTAYETILARYPVELLVYGHIHGDDLAMAYNEVIDLGPRSLRYENASADRVLMTPIRVLTL
ncbi:MAG: metallophosphoesterase [Planctomycetes bacterium]|nr:metallophosphoesterase [Planctomycetota bacterium]